MPRHVTKDDDIPRRRGSARTASTELAAERGLAMRMLLQSPKDMVAGVLAFAAVSAIIANALFLQAGHHPSPMFGSVVTFPAAGSAPASPLPRPRPVELAAKAVDPSTTEARPAESRPAEIKPTEPKAIESRAADPLGNLVKATSAVPAAANAPRPPASVPVAGQASRRVAAVQRVLTDYGYGQLKPTGMIGSDTQGAIQKFERDHKLPVTGQISDRLVRDLSAMIGHSID